MTKAPVVLLVGKPNSGKSLLFNRWTGLQQKVGNFAGVTVDIATGAWGKYTLADFPGVYSLRAVTAEEHVAVDHFGRMMELPEIHAVVCVLDATQLERSLNLGLQVLEVARTKSVPVVFALNLYDDILRNNLSIDYKNLEKDLGAPVVAISARTNLGLDELKLRVQDKNLKETVRALPRDSARTSAMELNKKWGFKSDVLLKRVKAIDRFFLSGAIGAVLFFAVMFFVFQAIFTWSVPLMDLTEQLVIGIGNVVSPLFPDGMAKDFFTDAIIAGIGSFVVFVPQIFILTFLIGLLEDSGYLSRVAIICHRPLRFFGLSGKSFIPFLSGHACAIPAIYATRMIDSSRVRLATMLTIPLIACSARLPIYSLFIVAVFPRGTKVFGIFNVQGVAFFALYILGYITAMLVSAMITSFKSKKKHHDQPFIIELPAYRLPVLVPLLRRSFKSAWQFLSEAGPIIFVTTLVIWVLGYFPNGKEALETSWLAQMGQWLKPALDPLGLDWKFGVAILTSFVAREVFVSTLGTLNGIDSAEENVRPLADLLNASGLTLASGVALLVFYAIALQCVSTLATIKRETKSTTIPVLLFLGYTSLAYLLAVICYAILSH